MKATLQSLLGNTLPASLLMAIGVTAPSHAVDKQELHLAKCAAAYDQELRTCAGIVVATQCYAQADQKDLDCRKAVNAVGHSRIEPIAQVAFDAFKNSIRPTSFSNRKPLNCSGTLNTKVCAEGHARTPFCKDGTNGSGNSPVGSGSIVVGEGKDGCTNGASLQCPAGFTQVPRSGEDLCWDRHSNIPNYQY